MKAITANQLSDGAVVYLGDDDKWTMRLSAAARFDNDEADDVLAAVKGRAHEITGAYLIDVDANGALHGREALRESIRRAGPTIRSDLGYQASAA